MSKGTLEIHSENILPIIKKWLYSDKDIFVRELVSNACDALYKVKVLRDQGLVQATDEELRIDIALDSEKRTLTFSDGGIGMNHEEVQKYIAQIAFSSAEEFVSKYKTNREGDQIIGHFGLGFYSAFMVSSRVVVDTLSYREGAVAALWSCDGSREYELEDGSRSQRGTAITLFLDGDSGEYLELPHIRKILQHYCSFLPYPIFLNGERINPNEPLWIRPPSECTKEDYLTFYRQLYPMEQDPLFWVHLNVDYPFHLKGILYFPKMHRRMDLNKYSVKLYCNRVFVSDNCKDIIPEYLMMLRGIIDSPDIPLNVSRSYLQMDRTVRQLANHISKKVSDSLGMLYKNERERYIEAWEDISFIVKLGTLEDEKFYDRVKDLIVWKNINGDWTTLAEYLERRGEGEHKVFYTSERDHFSPIVELYRTRNVEVICASSPIDNYLLHYLERKLSPVQFQRIDANVHEQLLDTEREKVILDASGRTEAAHLAELVSKALGDDTIEVSAKSLAADSLPGMIIIDEQERRMREYLKRLQSEEGESSPTLPLGKSTFVINTNNPLISALTKLNERDSNLTKAVIKQMYKLSLLSQKELDTASLKQFIESDIDILGQLVAKVVGQP